MPAPREPSPFAPGNPDHPSLRYLLLRFLRYGLLAWGGPVAQIALMHREVVERDRWVTEERFRKTLALYQALPGPEAMELAVWFGMVKRGRLGGVMGGLGFMLPGVAFVTLLAAAYVHWERVTLGVGRALLYGVKPAVIALLLVGFARLARSALSAAGGGGGHAAAAAPFRPDPVLVAAAALAVAVGLLRPDVSFVLVLLAGGALALGADLARRGRPAGAAALLAPLALVAFPAASWPGLGGVALVSAKAGLLSFGGAYTAIPFLQRGAVADHGWITNGQFLDAVALSGLVPGPLIAIGTFVGYLAGGLAGAAVATLCIFLPAFAFTLAGHDLFERLVHEPRLHAFLLGVTAAVVGLIVVATVPLALAAVVDAWTLLIALGALVALRLGRWPIPAALGAAAAAGLLLGAAGVASV